MCKCVLVGKIEDPEKRVDDPKEFTYTVVSGRGPPLVVPRPPRASGPLDSSDAAPGLSSDRPHRPTDPLRGVEG